MRRHDRFSINDAGLAHFAHHQGFDFRPFAMQHGHKGTIHTQYQFVWPLLDLRPVALDPFDLGQLHRFIGQTNRFGQPLGGRFAHRSLRKAGQQSCGFGKWHPNTQMSELIL